RVSVPVPVLFSAPVPLRIALIVAPPLVWTSMALVPRSPIDALDGPATVTAPSSKVMPATVCAPGRVTVKSPIASLPAEKTALLPLTQPAVAPVPELMGFQLLAAPQIPAGVAPPAPPVVPLVSQ